MAYAVLRVILERLRAEGRLLDDHAPPLQTADGRLIQVELIERPAVRDPAGSRVAAVRCVYTDLDGTLLGRGASLFRTGEGDFTLLAGARARGLPPGRRGGGDQVGPAARRR